MSYRAAPDPGGVFVSGQDKVWSAHLVESSRVGCRDARAGAAPGRDRRSPRLTRHGSGLQSQWPRAVIELGDHLDRLNIAALERVLGDVMLTGHTEIVIALPAPTVIDNDALIALCLTARRVTARGAALRIVGADRRVRDTLSLCGLDGVEFFSSIKRALARPRAGVIGRARLRGHETLEETPSGLNRSSSRSPS